MGRAFNSLKRVLELEAKQGFKDTAVVGGIRQFAVYWLIQAKEEAANEAEIALVEEVAETLNGYGRLPGLEAREEALQKLKEKLKAREEERETEQHAVPVAPQEPKRKAPTPVQDEASPPAAETIAEVKTVAPDPEVLTIPVTSVHGVGVKVAEKFAILGVETVGDLFYLFPRRYDDYTLLKPINRVAYGDQVTVIGTVWETRTRKLRGNRIVIQSIITDGSGKIQATWFNQPWLPEKLKAGMQIVLSGTVDQYLGRPVFQNPEWEPLAMEPLRTRRIVPVYPLTKGLSAQKVRETMKRATARWVLQVPDPLPQAIRERRHFLALPQALQLIHFPDNQETLDRARRRLTFDELFELQLGLLGQRREWQSSPGVPVPFDAETLKQFFRLLPYELTEAQKRVIKEIARDMSLDIPMNRLLQGDVGSGKTVIAAVAIVLAVHAGLQAALMAPTEILAEQHYQGIAALLSQLDINVVLLTGSTSAADREAILASLADGSAQVIIGTHALIQESVNFGRLGLAVVDEQHRFGVDQRKALREKGVQVTDGSERASPHLLVMSATPIPRSLALSYYGDLDLSILDEMPPGRLEIKTNWLRPSERERAYAFVRGQIENGRQAFVICPLVEESDKIEAKSAVEEYERLQTQVFSDLKLGLLHGRMKPAEKEAAMRAFYEGETDILVATSVIEVGIDVPNSTVMLIEGANRFGLAQLHQFRGRVGRGEHQSFCLLLSDEVSGDAEDRLSALEQTNDGFMLAEKDLEIRGPGEFLGRRQSGMPELHLASLTDMKVLEVAREEAQGLIEIDPFLDQPEHQLLLEKVAKLWQQAGDVS